MHACSSQVVVGIEVADANDQTPVFLNQPYTAVVNEVMNKTYPPHTHTPLVANEVINKTYPPPPHTFDDITVSLPIIIIIRRREISMSSIDIQ